MVALSYRIKMNSIFPERSTNDRDFNTGKKNIFKFAIYGGVDTFDLRGGGLAFIFGSNLPIFWLHA